MVPSLSIGTLMRVVTPADFFRMPVGSLRNRATEQQSSVVSPVRFQVPALVIRALRMRVPSPVTLTEALLVSGPLRVLGVSPLIVRTPAGWVPWAVSTVVGPAPLIPPPLRVLGPRGVRGLAPWSTPPLMDSPAANVDGCGLEPDPRVTVPPVIVTS